MRRSTVAQVRNLERAAGTKFAPTNAPSPQTVMRASAGMAQEQMMRVPDELLPYFEATAVEILAESNEPTQVPSPTPPSHHLRRRSS